MVRRVVFSLLIAVIILFLTCYAEDNFHMRYENYSVEVIELMDKSKPQFLSDDYFNRLNEIFEKLKEKNGSERIAANAVLNRMMDDLEDDPDALEHNKNSKRFFETFDNNVRKLDSVTKRIHFFRNTLNSYNGAPEKLEDMLDLAAKGEWHLFSAKFHRFNYGNINGALNIKFLSSEGRFEAVYNTGTGKIITDPANMGTYNYAPGSINPIRFYFHTKLDKNPWRRWGNIEGFTYKDIVSLKSGHGTNEAINNEKEVERLIQKRSNK